MNEEQWLACTDPRWMLGHLNGKMGARRCTLFLAACLWAVRDCLDDAASRRAVLAVERFADGFLSREQLQAVFLAGWKTGWEKLRSQTAAALAALENAEPYSPIWVFPRTAAELWARRGEYGRGWPPDPPPRTRFAAAEAAQVARLRDIFGNPFRPAPAPDSGWRTWNDGTIPKMARAIYEEGTFDHLPVLADALEEAGCTDVNILEHCRGPGPHVKGCWVVDLLLGKS